MSSFGLSGGPVLERQTQGLFYYVIESYLQFELGIRLCIANALGRFVVDHEQLSTFRLDGVWAV
jgi:hypothetical protein